MIDMSSSMLHHMNNLDTENERISYQMSTGKILDMGSDDSVLFAQTLDIEDNMRVYDGLKKQIEKTKANNDVSDSTMSEIKSAIDLIKVDLLKSFNEGADVSARSAIATNISGLRENLFSISNTKVDGEYIFTGSNTNKQTFTKDSNFAANGKVDFGGDSILRKIAVEPGTYRERGITGYDVLMHNSDTAGSGEQLNFTPQERIVDENNLEWKITDSLTVGGTIQSGDKFNITVGGATISVAATDTSIATTAGLIKDAINNDATASSNVVASLDSSNNIIISSKIVGKDFTTTVSTTESDGVTASNGQTFAVSSDHDKIRQFDKNGDSTDTTLALTTTGAQTSYTTSSGAIVGAQFLEAKHNYFDDLNVMINALKGYSTNTDGTKGSTLTTTEIKDTLRTSLEITSNQFDASNVGHGELGGRNNVFNIALERIDAKKVHYNILMQEVGGADLAKLAVESKSLEMTYQALYSTVSKMYSLSLLNYMK